MSSVRRFYFSKVITVFCKIQNCTPANLALVRQRNIIYQLNAIIPLDSIVHKLNYHLKVHYFLLFLRLSHQDL